MKESETRSRRRKCSVNRTVYANAYSIYTAFTIIIILLGSHCQHVISSCSARTKLGPYDVATSPRSYISIFRIRGGEEDSTLLGRLGHHSNLISTAHHDRTSIFLSTLQSNRALWRRIRLLRGGVDDGKNEDCFEEPGCNDGESESVTSSMTEDTSDTVQEHPAAMHYLWYKKSESALVSFLSRFWSPVETGDDHTIRRTINTTGIAHKMPHGPDGRGGGMTVLLDRPHKSSIDSSNDQDREKGFVITTEVTNAFGEIKVADTTVDTEKSVSNTDNKQSDKYPVAFAVPPHIVPSYLQPRKEGDSKISTVSKIEEMVAGVNETASMNKKSMSRALNSTIVIESSIGRTSDNTTAADIISGGLELKDYTSSGYWVGIDLIASLGLSSVITDLKLSRALRPVRKFAAKTTGLHGLISGKEYKNPHFFLDSERAIGGKASTIISIDEELGIHDANAVEAEILARRFASRRWRQRAHTARSKRSNNNFRRGWRFRRRNPLSIPKGSVAADYVLVPVLDISPDALEQRRRNRVEEIDVLLHRGFERLLELQCERDDLLSAPNPLFNYTKKYDPSTNQTFGDVRTTREFNFPSPELVNEYIGELVSHGRLRRLNHTELWRSQSDYGLDDDEIVGDDLLTPGVGARKLYENGDQLETLGNINKSGGGSWLLRTGLGGGSLGEKLGEAIEISAYKGVCSAVMSVFARMLSNLHGVNVLSHSDIRMYIEQDPDLPPVDKKYGPLSRESNYAQEVIKTAIQKGSKKKRKTSKSSSSQRSSTRHHGHELSDDAFIQRGAVVETLVSHCQISAPLLKLFPLDWQRAMVGNIITLATAIVSDFADGLQVQLLGHALTVSFKPITEADMIQQIGGGGFRQNHRRTRPDEFEAAVLATAVDISENLAFLDGWLEWCERKVGGGVLRAQISNLIARVVLTLIDEVLSGARLDLWSSQANGPRLYAALEYRTPNRNRGEE